MLEPLRPGSFTRKFNADESPYAGLSAFQEADASKFFGRKREIATAATRLRDQPLLGIVGPSGVGKSSFIRAGVVPALKQSGETWETLVVRPGRNPMAALAHTLASFGGGRRQTGAFDVTGQTGNTGSTGNTGPSSQIEADGLEHEAILRRLYAEPGHFGNLLRKRARRGDRKIMLFIDQFEELYTLTPDLRERLAFTSCLAGVADDATTPLRVVLSIRSDFLDRVTEDAQFMSELTKGIFFLSPPDRGGLREAIVQPAEMAGFHYQSSTMVEDMLNHLENTPGALPLLQFAATKLWDARDRDQKMLTEDSYQAIGGIMGALASHADSVIAELPPSARQLVRTIFLRLVTPERTRDVVAVSELYTMAQNPQDVQLLVDHLVQARLLVVQTGDMSDESGGALVEIVHESMLHGWPTLRRWLDDNQDDAAFLEQLRNATKQWQARGYPTGLLWRGEAMEEAKRWHKRYTGRLPDLQVAYLNSVFALARKSVRRKRMLLGTVIAVLMLMVAAAVVALVQIRDAEKVAKAQARQAEAAQRVALAAQKEAQGESKKSREKEQEARASENRAKAALSAQELAEQNEEQALEIAKRKAADLAIALGRAKRAQRRARRAAKRAERSKKQAVVARNTAQDAKDDLAEALAKEQQRLAKLQARMGGIMKVLKE